MDPLAIQDLARSGISETDATRAAMFSVDTAQQIYPEFENLPALVLPYYDPQTLTPMVFERDGKQMPFARIRYTKEPIAKVTFAKKKMQRYGQPINSGVFPYFPCGTAVNWLEVLTGNGPIVITEGEKKALAGCLAGLPTIGLGGVFNFLSDGGLLPALDKASWKKRAVYILFDSDAAENPTIQAAEGRLASLLSQKRRAKVHVVRLPQTGDGKCGLDDFIVEQGRDALFDLLEATPQIRKIDAAVLAMNEDVCWIENEGKVYDMSARIFIEKGNFQQGSKYSTRTVIQPTVKGDGVKEVSVASKWLSHPHAQRYDGVMFDPTSTDSVVEHNGSKRLNLWRGWDPVEGPVDEFLKLNNYLFSNLPPSQRDLCFKLLVYKFQNPGKKIPLAPVFIGSQGSGKSLWCRCMMEAAGEYGQTISSDAILSNYNGYLEKSLVCVINEAKPEHVSKGAENLREMISEKTAYLNIKYRKQERISTYTTYLITANKREVADYEGDDRRMIVVDAPPMHPDKREFYGPIFDWLEGGGAKHLLHYMLSYDLEGWTPPAHAPLTREKYLARLENMTAVERIAEDMQTADQNQIGMWIHAGLLSTKVDELSQDANKAQRAREAQQALSRIQIRPFYTPTELAAIFPMVAEQFYNDKRVKNAAGHISKVLRENGIRTIDNKDDVRGFRDPHTRRFTQYLVIADPQDWPKAVTENEMERLLAQFPTYFQWAQNKGLTP